MTFKDPKAIELLDRVDNDYVWEWVKDYCPEVEEDDRSDLQILQDIAEQVYELWIDSGCRQYHELREARKFLKETQDGKCFSFRLEDMHRMNDFILEKQKEVDHARYIIAEYERLKGVVQTLRKMRL